MSMLIKICGLRDQTHIAAAVDAGANAIGFVFAKSVRRVTPRQALNASQGMPPGVLRVAVMRHPTNDEWTDVLDVFAPDVLQTDAADFATLKVPDNVTRWPVLREGDQISDDDVSGEFVYEGVNSGEGKIVNWSRAANIARRGRMILAGGLSATNVVMAIQTTRPYGVDTSSAVESRPGEKDSVLIRQFINAVRTAEKNV